MKTFFGEKRTMFLLGLLIFGTMAQGGVVDLQGPFLVDEGIGSHGGATYSHRYYDVTVGTPDKYSCYYSPDHPTGEIKYFGDGEGNAGITLRCLVQFASRQELEDFGFRERSGEESSLAYETRSIGIPSPAPDVQAGLFLTDFSLTEGKIKGIGAFVTLRCKLNSSYCKPEYLRISATHVQFPDIIETRIKLDKYIPAKGCFPDPCEDVAGPTGGG